jgi:hypothetical protein
VYTQIVRKGGGKRPHRRPRYKRKNNIKMDLQEIGCDGMKTWTQDPIKLWMDICEQINEPSGSMKE